MWVCIVGRDLTNHLRFEEFSAKCLADLMIGTKQIRYGALPSTANYTHLVNTLDARVATGRPITLTVMWGAMKAYDHFDIRSCDLLDLMALKRLMCLNEAVKRIYSPGIEVKIIWEDLTEQLTTGKDSTAYLLNFRELLAALDMRFVEVILESTLSDCTGYVRSIYSNADAIAAGRESEVGWQGPILWDYFIGRATSEYPDATDAYRRERVALYLGICLARYQYKVLPAADVKLSFAPYPKEVPDSFRRGRVEYKIKANGKSESTIPPWCGFGVLRPNDWTHISSRQFASGNFMRTVVKVNGVPLHLLEAA